MNSSWMLVAGALTALVVAPACGGGDPVDVSGEYSVSVTNRENGCMFENWEEGNTAQNIPVAVTQDGADASATVGGAAGLFLDLVLGSRVFEGTVDGEALDFTLFGTNSATQDGCAYTVNSRMVATLNGDVLTGNLRYTTETNGSPDCGELEGCESRQQFNGTRPPTE